MNSFDFSRVKMMFQMGKTIQVYIQEEKIWVDVVQFDEDMPFSPEFEYRVKPEDTKKIFYRRYIQKNVNKDGEVFYDMNIAKYKAYKYEEFSNFHKWVDDKWLEYNV